MEKDITTSIIDWINEQPGCFAFKRLSNGSSSTNGYPDITGSVMIKLSHINLGVRLEIEVKQPKKKPTKIQYARLRDFRKLGCIAIWTDNKKDAIYQIRSWLRYFEGKALHPGNKDLEGPSLVVLSDLAA